MRGRHASLTPTVPDVTALTSQLSPAIRVEIEQFLTRLADMAERHADRLVSAAERTATAAARVPTPVLWS